MYIYIYTLKMDPNLLKNLGLDSSLNQNDIQLLNQILSSVGPGGNKKPPKMTAKDKNNLITKLSSNTTLNETPKKELKDMNEQEKKIYREEIKKKLKNKQNELKMGRTSNLAKQKIANQPNFNQPNFNEAIGKLSEMMKNVNPSVLDTLNLNQADNMSKQETDTTEQKINTSENKTNILKQETLINNIINQTNKDENFTIDEPDNFDDYLN